MKWMTSAVILTLLAACNGKAEDTQQLKDRIDSLQQQLDHTYKPGLGEFMSSIQVHHAKLWFAGTNKNWRLAEFEVNEMEEAFGNIREYCADRPEVKSLPMIDPPMDSLKSAVAAKNQQLFKSSYLLLTNTCNGCHRATQHEFNIITLPAAPPFANQNFTTSP